MLSAGECQVLETHSHPGPGSRFSSHWQLHWLADKPGGDERSDREREGDGQSRWRRTEVITRSPRGHMSFSDWPIACLTFHLRFTLSLSPQNHSIRMLRNQHSKVDTFFFPRRDVARQPVLQQTQILDDDITIERTGEGLVNQNSGGYVRHTHTQWVFGNGNNNNNNVYNHNLSNVFL